MQNNVKLTFWETCSLSFTLLRLPAVVLYTAITSRWSESGGGKPTARAIYYATVRFVTSRITIRHLQSFGGTTYSTYQTWAKQAKIDPTVDELGDDARLLWIGPKRSDRVVLYCHGGGFAGPVADFQLAFLHRVRTDLSKRPTGQELGVAVLQYTLHPASFPTQLEQLMLAMHHLLSAGVPPANLYLAGESAGGNLICQLLSHTLHPVPLSIPTSPLSSLGAPLGGVCLMSPWIALSKDSWTHKIDDRLDIVTSKTLDYWGSSYIASVPSALHVYVQPTAASAPVDWFVGVNKLVDRVFVTVGGDETLSGEIADFGEVLKKVHRGGVKVEVQLGGVHADPVFSYAADLKVEKLGYVLEMIIDWLAEGFADGSK